MKLLYVTSIDLPSYRANRIQIVSMARAWTKILDKDFVLGVGEIKDKALPGINFIETGKNVKSYNLSWGYLKFAKQNRFTDIYCREEKVLFFMLVYNKLFFKNKFKFHYEIHHLIYMKKWWHDYVLNNVSSIISITYGMKRVLIDNGYGENKIIVSPDAVDPSLFNIVLNKEEIRKKLNLPNDKKIIIYTGAIIETWKGVGTLYESSKYLDDSFLFMVIGGKPHYRDIFNSAYPPRKNFILLGHKEHKEIPEYLKAGDVLVLPNSAKSEISVISTSPMKLFEYMASNVPIVASDLTSIREILNEKNAIFVEPDNPKSLALGIARAFEYPDISEALARQARLDVGKYTWDKRATDIAKFIQNF